MSDDEEDEPLFSDHLLAGILADAGTHQAFMVGVFRGLLAAHFHHWQRVLKNHPNPKLAALDDAQRIQLAARSAIGDVAWQFPEPIQSKLLDAEDKLVDELLTLPGEERVPTN